MATIREYYEKDFAFSAKMHIRLPFRNDSIEGIVHYDFNGFSAFLSCFVTGKNKDLDYFIDFISSISFGKTQVVFDQKITLPALKEFPGQLRIENEQDIEIQANFFGDTEWISTKDIQASRRIFIYSESNLELDELQILKQKGKELGHELQFRAENFRAERSKNEVPLAFISHDSKDKEDIAKIIAIHLQKMLCPVWYDEFSLSVGDNLRESIEKGLKECKKCILILSPNFISNTGWTKTEFDSIFTRQILEDKKLVLPIWYNVEKQDIYEYSPSLLNIKGLNWKELGEDEVCNKLYNAIINAS